MKKDYLTRAGIILAVLLLGMKLWASVVTSSMSVLSDALNSFLDIFSYSVIHISVKLHHSESDQNHHFGHRRAEPIASFIIAILAAILGATIIKDSFLGIFEEHTVKQNTFAVGIMIFAIFSKLVIAVLYKFSAKKHKSTALEASYIDSRNDVLASVIAIMGMLIGGYWDHIFGLIIGLWIMYSGTSLGYKNLKYLMGNVPSIEIIDLIRLETINVNGVIGINDLRAHYVGDVVHVEIHIEVDEKLNIKEAHEIGITVRDRLENLQSVQKAFVHIDPISEISQGLNV
ncbi:cation diffusion facilitator family transporter [Candidatus Poribacteria bacterium]|nr:cation diffusion facilitator family transporter [Candidatus Poribacteria bacterium]